MVAPSAHQRPSSSSTSLRVIESLEVKAPGTQAHINRGSASAWCVCHHFGGGKSRSACLLAPINARQRKPILAPSIAPTSALPAIAHQAQDPSSVLLAFISREDVAEDLGANRFDGDTVRSSREQQGLLLVSRFMG